MYLIWQYWHSRWLDTPEGHYCTPILSFVHQFSACETVIKVSLWMLDSTCSTMTLRNSTVLQNFHNYGKYRSSKEQRLLRVHTESRFCFKITWQVFFCLLCKISCGAFFSDNWISQAGIKTRHHLNKTRIHFFSIWGLKKIPNHSLKCFQHKNMQRITNLNKTMVCRFAVP